MFAATRVLTVKRVIGSRDRRAGFPVWRTHSWLLESVFANRLDRWHPDVVLTQLGCAGDIAHWALAAGVQPMIFLRDSTDHDFTALDVRNPSIMFIANSKYMASWTQSTFGRLPPVIYPPVDVSGLRRARDPQFVTFINPVAQKGLELALSIAAKLPKVRFLFVESWPLGSKESNELAARLRARPNIVFWRRRKNMQTVYDVTRLLLVPSQGHEAFGRVVVEAQACGIPIIARQVGGLPEAVGSGGIVLGAMPDVREQDLWAATIESLLADRDRLSAYGEIAVTNAQQGPWSPSKVGAAFESILHENAGATSMRGFAIPNVAPQPRKEADDE